jgi:hypothetical protein
MIQVGIVLNSSNIDIYLTSDNTLLQSTFTILKGDYIRIVVVAEEVPIHLAMVLRRAENIVNLARTITLTTNGLGDPTT